MKIHQRESGVSLIEALVALAIMAFGMLGVIGMQATLRFNADVSKQRSEAVRLAQEEIERLRNFGVLATTSGIAPFAFDDIANVAAATVAVPTSANTTYTRTTTVAPAVAGDPLLKKVTVTVNWLDRRATSSTDLQAVTLTTVIAGIAPELAGSLGIPGDQAATQRPRERHSAIPIGATNQGSTSTFAPPGGGSLVWVFNNATGMITSMCNPGCTPFNAWLLTGFIQFAVSGAPTALIAESPSDGAIPAVGVNVLQTVPILQTVLCRTSLSSTFLTYYCAVQTFGTNPWSGRSELTGIALATALTDVSASQYKVCRYTSVQSPTTPGNNNAEHPLNYVSVGTPLTNQNFLVTLAGDGALPYSCPGDVPGNLVNSTTYQHQPSS